MADLTTYNMIYGRPWLVNHQPHLNWRNNDVRFRHRRRSVHVNASAYFGENDVILSQISGSINAVETNRLVCEENEKLFVVLVREDTDASVLRGKSVLHLMMKESNSSANNKKTI